MAELFEQDGTGREIWSVFGPTEDGGVIVVVSDTVLTVDSAAKLATALLDAAGLE